jgi:hypothetical protein
MRAHNERLQVQEFNKLLLAYIEKALLKTAETHRNSAMQLALDDAKRGVRIARLSLSVYLSVL